MKLVKIDDIPKSDDVVEVDLGSLNDVFHTCMKMQTICRLHNGIGLSAVQVGIPLKLFVVLNNDNTFTNYANCEYTPHEKSKPIYSLEGCLSIPQKHYSVLRRDVVRVNGFILNRDKATEIKDMVFKGMMSIVLQHEIDHHNGILISDKGRLVYDDGVLFK